MVLCWTLQGNISSHDQNVLNETSLDLRLLAVNKEQRENYSGTSSSDLQIVLTNTWFG